MEHDLKPIKIPKRLTALEKKFGHRIIERNRLDFLCKLEKDTKKELLWQLVYFIAMVPDTMYEHFLISYHNQLCKPPKGEKRNEPTTETN